MTESDASKRFTSAAIGAIKSVDWRGGQRMGVDFSSMDQKQLDLTIHGLQQKIAFADRAYAQGVGKVSKEIAQRTLRDTKAMMDDLAEARAVQSARARGGHA